MKIVVFSSGYLPGEKYGGPVTSLVNFVQALGEDHDIYIICTNHDLHETEPYGCIKPGWNIVGKAKVMYLSKDRYNIKVFYEILNELNPDLIYASSFFSVKQTYPLLTLSKEFCIPLLIAPRGELNNDALKIKRIKKLCYIIWLRLRRELSNVFFQATSYEEKLNVINNLNVRDNRVLLLPNFPTLQSKKYCIDKAAGELKLVFVGRIVENKNLITAIKAVIKSKYNICFDIVGPCEDKNYWDRCKELISRAPKNVRISYLGTIPSSKMCEVYKQYDCLISPTFFENYGQAIVEAMLNDVPVIISRGTTPWDNIVGNNCGSICAVNNVNEFADAIDHFGAMNSEEYDKIISNLREYCVKTFNINSLVDIYSSSFRYICSHF